MENILEGFEGFELVGELIGKEKVPTVMDLWNKKYVSGVTEISFDDENKKVMFFENHESTIPFFIIEATKEQFENILNGYR